MFGMRFKMIYTDNNLVATQLLRLKLKRITFSGYCCKEISLEDFSWRKGKLRVDQISRETSQPNTEILLRAGSGNLRPCRCVSLYVYPTGSFVLSRQCQCSLLIVLLPCVCADCVRTVCFRVSVPNRRSATMNYFRGSLLPHPLRPLFPSVSPYLNFSFTFSFKTAVFKKRVRLAKVN